jgi:hypothetical protein
LQVVKRYQATVAGSFRMNQAPPNRPLPNAGKWPGAGAPVDEIDATLLTFKILL